LSKAVKLQRVCCTGQQVDSEQSNAQPQLIGPLNETVVKLDGVSTLALLDTGSQVSCISESFYKEKLSHVELQPLNTLLQVEGVGGNLLPYSGCVEVEMSFPCRVLGETKTLHSLLLVTPDTKYNARCPILLGTNVIANCLKFHSNFVEESNLPQAWKIAFQCMVTNSHELSKAVEVKTESCVSVHPNSSCLVSCVHDGVWLDARCLIMVDASDASSVPGGLLVTPMIHQGNSVADKLPVLVTNCSERTITIPAKTTIGHAMPVTIASQQVCTEQGRISMEELEKLFPLEHLSTAERSLVYLCLEKHQKAFSWDDWDLGHCTIEKHKIKLTDDTPFRERYRRIPPAMVDEVRTHLKQMLDAGVIEESKSPFASAAVFVRKSDGSLRFCIDFRRLNERTVRDAHYLPRIDDTFDRLAGSTWFSTLDLKAGYWQVEMDPDDSKYTAFTAGCLGFYQWKRLPMGLSNSASTFQRVMETVMGSANLQSCLLYLDDIIVFAKDFEQHLQRLDNVLTKLEEAGLKLKPSKCCLFQKEIKYLGHILSQEGIKTDQDKIQKILEWPAPENRKQLHRFLGFTGYYRRFVKDYAKLAQPLQKLLVGQTKKKKGKKTKDDKVKLPPFEWGDEQQQSFKKLIEALTSAPVLVFADFNQPFVLQTDASSYGLGAVLHQERDGKLHPIAFASRGLSSSEKNYPAHKLEFLAMKWAICEKFNDYLYAAKFQVVTDNNPLTYVMSSAKLDATGLRWVAELSSYDFSLKYRPGRLNQAADSLSRMNDWEELDSESVRAICGGVNISNYISCFSISADVMPEVLTQPCGDAMTKDDWKKSQQEDEMISAVYEAIEKDQQLKSDNMDTRRLWRQRKQLITEDGLLYRRRNEMGVVQKQLVLPKGRLNEILTMLHDKMGHLGRDRVIDLVRTRFYWNGMKRDIEEWIGKCDRCLRRKQPTNQVAPMEHLTSARPMELICMDFLTLETSVGGYGNILVLTDNFTKYAMAVATKNQTAKTTAKALIDLFVNHYGIPERLHSDQGKNFTGHVIQHLCQMLDIKKSRTTPFHPQSNGNCERFNQTLLNMLGTLAEDKKTRWKDHLQAMVFAYNCTRCETTGYSPFELMYGRKPRIPADVMFGLEEQGEGKTYNEYIEDLRSKMSDAYKVVKANIDRAQGRSKMRYDTKVRGTTVEVGDRVLVKKVYFGEGKHKLADKWEENVYVVVKKKDGFPVYDVKPEVGKGRTRRLHRNMLLPIGKKNEPDESEESEEEELETFRTGEEKEGVDRGSDDQEQEMRTERVVEEESEEETQEEEEEPRRSTRVRKPPDRYGDWVTNFSGNVVPAQMNPQDKVMLVNKLLDFLK
jgi:transposase InsO family protein